ncbi:MAG: leucyl aminopeptidase [Tateyamaria sp.]|nr:leucyl aminopeptidase [Tateyamaria sp.]
MTYITPISFAATDLNTFANTTGRLAVIVSPEGKLGVSARKLNRLTKGAIHRFIQSDNFKNFKPSNIISLAWPSGLIASSLDIVCLPRDHSVAQARNAGAALAKLRGKECILLALDGVRRADEIAFGLAMRDYRFIDHKTDAVLNDGAVTVMCTNPKIVEAAYAPLLAVIEGTFLTRDLVNEPANVLTTNNFANRLEEMSALGLKVEVLDEKELEQLGMRTLLCVGQGSESPSKVVIMKWDGGQQNITPFALVGKGVVFDTGGISLKPAAGMEDMTMDMGGAGVVAGAMRALALRKAKANVVGIVGLVENMPSGNATRPGDVIKSMKGDTVEVINTDAEGRLVLCDLLWYAQERFNPSGIIDLATLTGAIIIGLGHEKAGVFSNNDKLCNAFLKAAATEGEGAWRMPLGQSYDDMLKSRIADMKNIGGRPAGSVTAAQFLQRFVKPETPWIHLDIAGVASVTCETELAPKGATGWGVMALNRLISDFCEN